MSFGEKAIASKGSSRRKWCIIGTVVAIIILIVVIVVPIAVLVPKRSSSELDHDATNVIMPLYVYPSQTETWNPMFEAIESRPDMPFLIIVNPNSGPGSDPLPNDDYVRNITKLSSYANVRNVGYVPTTFGQRNISDVLADIETYAGWSKANGNLAMQGIFFDESIYEYNEDAVEYMRTITKAVKDADGITGNKTVIRNPGTVQDGRYEDPNTDIVVVFEETYETFTERRVNVEAISNIRTANSLMVHSVPTLSKDDLRTFVNQLSMLGQYLFVTTNEVNYYNSFASDWSEFIEVVPSRPN